jgi:hypothetical protein
MMHVDKDDTSNAFNCFIGNLDMPYIEENTNSARKKHYFSLIEGILRECWRQKKGKPRGLLFCAVRRRRAIYNPMALY